MMKKTASMILAAVMIFTASIATAKTVEPESTETNGLAGVTVHATVGEYDTQTKTFRVTLYDDDRFAVDNIEKLDAGDTLLAGGRLYRVKEKMEEESGDILVVTEDGYEIVFFQVGDEDMIAQSTDDDRRYMHAFSMFGFAGGVSQMIVKDDGKRMIKRISDSKPCSNHKKTSTRKGWIFFCGDSWTRTNASHCASLAQSGSL